MTIDLNTEGLIHIAFQHRQVSISNTKMGNESMPLRIIYDLPYDIKAVTKCLIIWDSELGEVASKGEAYCSYRDNFSKSKGRQIALKRALDSLDINKSIRTTIWTQYLECK